MMCVHWGLVDCEVEFDGGRIGRVHTRDGIASSSWCLLFVVWLWGIFKTAKLTISIIFARARRILC